MTHEVPPRLEGIEHRNFTLEAFEEFYPPRPAAELHAQATEGLARDGIASAEQVELTFVMRPDEALQVSAVGKDDQGRTRSMWVGHWPPRDQEVPIALAIFETKAGLKARGYIP